MIMQTGLDRILVYQLQGSGSWMVAVDYPPGCLDFAVEMTLGMVHVYLGSSLIGQFRFSFR